MLTPTQAQTEVRDYPDLSLLVTAPAGCGKTEALALRVTGLIERGQIGAGQRILVTTFTNRARDNILARIKSYLPSKAIKTYVTVSNFHGFAARVFRAHANVIGLDPGLVLPESDWVGDQCKARSLSFSAANAVQEALRETKQEAVTDAEVDRLLARGGHSTAREFERQRIAEGLLTYDDLPRLAELILANDAVANLYGSHFATVLVDEFQDLTPQQYRIVTRIAHGRTTYAGDLAQGIYSFAGASPNVVNQLVRDECRHEITFSDSHRSSPAVLNAVNALAPLTGGVQLTAANPSSWPSGGLAWSGRFASVEAEATWSVDFCRAVLSRAPNHRVGILSRIGSRRRFIDDEIEASDLPHQRWDDAFLDTDTAQRLKSMLSGLSLNALGGAADPVRYLRDAAGMASVHDPSSRQALAEAVMWCYDLIQQRVNVTDIKKRIHTGDNESLLTLPGVHLLTGHVGKGQQFDWVVIAGLEDGSIPDFRANTSETQTEEARVLSVMISRARHGVLLTRCAALPAASTGTLYQKHDSRFLTTLNGHVTDGAHLNTWLQDADWRALASR